MDFVFDPAKDAANITKHGLSLADFRGFDDDADVRIDSRYDYAEVRYRAWGRIEGRGYCVVFTFRGAKTRLISFRRAHDKEMRRNE